MNQWRALRGQIDRVHDGLKHADFDQGETSAKELEEMIAAVEALKSLVVGIGGPATFIVRQGLKQDLHVLQQALAGHGAPS